MTDCLKDTENIISVSNEILKNLDKNSGTLIIPKKINIKGKFFNPKGTLITQLFPYVEEEKTIQSETFQNTENEIKKFFSQIKNVLFIIDKSAPISKNIVTTVSQYFFNDEEALSSVYSKKYENIFYETQDLKSKEKLDMFARMAEKNIQKKDFTKIMLKTEVNITFKQEIKKITKTPKGKEIEVIDIAHSSISKELKIFYLIEEVI